MFWLIDNIVGDIPGSQETLCNSLYLPLSFRNMSEEHR